MKKIDNRKTLELVLAGKRKLMPIMEKHLMIYMVKFDYDYMVEHYPELVLKWQGRELVGDL
jgi:hypothetical protein